MLISDEELARERIPLALRDCCAHLLVPLNRCRRRNLYLPFRCHEERHEYEQCLYNEYHLPPHTILTSFSPSSFLRRSRLLQQQRNNKQQ